MGDSMSPNESTDGVKERPAGTELSLAGTLPAEWVASVEFSSSGMGTLPAETKPLPAASMFLRASMAACLNSSSMSLENSKQNFSAASFASCSCL